MKAIRVDDLKSFCSSNEILQSALDGQLIVKIGETDRGDDKYELLIDHIPIVDVLDKIRAEIIDTLYVDSLIFGELVDFRNGKISADDVIEEFNRVTRAEVLQIIDRYKAESEGL